jgi:hypothetical protein
LLEFTEAVGSKKSAHDQWQPAFSLVHGFYLAISPDAPDGTRMRSTAERPANACDQAKP